jgi:hypothetical protein
MVLFILCKKTHYVIKKLSGDLTILLDVLDSIG